MSPYVARIVNIIQNSGTSYQLGPMGTCIEGEWDDVMQVVHACYAELESDCDRIYFTIKGDCRKGRTDGLNQKTASVKARLLDSDS